MPKCSFVWLYSKSVPMSLKRARSSSTQIFEPEPFMPRFASRSFYGQSSKGFRRTRRAYRRRAPVRVRRGVASRASALTAIGVGSTHVINRDNGFIHRVSKTSVVNTIGGASTTVNGVEIFDPSGTYGTGFGAGAAAAIMPEWAAFTGLFDQYHVNSITVTMTHYPGGSVAGQTADVAPCVMYGRYNYNRGATATSSAPFGLLSDVKEHLFTTAAPKCSWKIYPKVCKYTATTGVLSTQGEEVAKQGWTDVNDPTELYGMVWYSPNLVTGMGLRIELTYDVSFKYNK